MSIYSKVPLRVSLFGGGTDMPEYFSQHGSRILSFAIDKYIRVQFRKNPKYSTSNYRFIFRNTEELYTYSSSSNPVFKNIFKFMESEQQFGEYIYQSDMPSMSGIGSSSAFAICMLNLLNFLKSGKKIKSKELAKKSIFFEQKILKEKVGIQDQIACSYGGFNIIKVSKDGQFNVENIYNKKNKLKIKKLLNSFLLIHTGKYRYASDMEKQKKFGYLDLSYLNEASIEAEKKLKSKKFELYEIGKLLNETWKIKKTISDSVSSPQIDYLYDLIIKKGGIGGKLIGAGGGGFLLVQVPEEKQKKIIEFFSKKLIFKIKCCNSKPQIYEDDF